MRLYRIAYEYDKNSQYLWNGEKFWSGACDPLDGEIIETHTYEEAKDAGFHHSLYFWPPTVRAMDDDEAVFFWIQDGYIMTQWRHQEDIPELTAKIRSQLTQRDYRQEIEQELVAAS